MEEKQACSRYHQPVLLSESIEGLAIREDGVYVDLTFGGGGHSSAILEKLKNGKLIVFDQDQEARQNSEGLDVTFVEANFRFLKRYLKLYGVAQVDGILADLGVSSHQIDEADRGFSVRFNADLDMRMSKDVTLTAKQVINQYSEAELHKIFGMYGEVRNAKTLARTIVSARVNKPLHTVDDLKAVLKKAAPKNREFKYFAQVFQALRIEVNDEMGALEEMLGQAVEVLKPEGRLVVIAYHSLEDRLVKNLMQKGNLKGEEEKDFYGNIIRPLKPVTRKPILPSREELARNNRARSAKLRIAEKL